MVMKNPLSIGQFQRIREAEKLDDDIFKQINILSTLTGMDVNDLKAIPYGKLGQLANDEVEKWDFDFNEESYITKIEVNGTTYHAITDLHKILISQVIDLSQYANGEEAIIENLHYIAAILLREDKDKYEGESLDERAEIMRKHCSSKKIYNTAVFFCKLLSKLPSLLLETKMTNPKPMP